MFKAKIVLIALLSLFGCSTSINKVNYKTDSSESSITIFRDSYQSFRNKYQIYILEDDEEYYIGHFNSYRPLEIKLKEGEYRLKVKRLGKEKVFSVKLPKGARQYFRLVLTDGIYNPNFEIKSSNTQEFNQVTKK